MTLGPVTRRPGGVGPSPSSSRAVPSGADPPPSTPSPGESGARETAEDLAVRARGGSTAAYSRLVERFAAPLCSFLALRTGSWEDGEELAQEAFLRAWQRIERYDDGWRFSTWLFTLAKRLAASRMRKRRHRTEGADALAEAVFVEAGLPQDPARQASAREQGENLWNVAARVLSSDQRSALWLRYAEDLSAREVARVLGKRESTVRVILFRARERLARHLEDPLGEGRPTHRAGQPASPALHPPPPELPARLAGDPT